MKITVYTKNNCMQCEMTKKILNKNKDFTNEIKKLQIMREKKTSKKN